MALNIARYLQGFTNRYKQLLKHPFLCILKEKHGDRYFHCKNVEDLQRVALKIVTERFREGLYTTEARTDALGMTDAQILALPEGTIRNYALEQQVQRERRQHQDAEEQQHETVAREAALEENGGLALWVLEHRERYEYEAFVLEEYESFST